VCKTLTVFLLYFIRLNFELFEGDLCSCTSSPPRLDNFGYQAASFFVQKQTSLFKMPKTQPDEVYNQDHKSELVKYLALWVNFWILPTLQIFLNETHTNHRFTYWKDW
jgi:hypothetical protein